MLLIDFLIHVFHARLSDGKLNRSVANHLVEGSHQQILDVLDRLYALPRGVDKAGWRASSEEMLRRRQRGVKN